MMEFRSFPQAIVYYRKAKKVCERYQRYREKLLMYQQIGYMYRLMKDHEEAVKQFQKML